MREIKFRAWDKDERKWCDYQVYIDSNGETYYEHYERGLDYNLNVEINQYTGLKDKNGVDIYEGDIVQIKDHSFQRKPDGYTGIEIDGFYPVTYTERMELVAGQWLLMHQLPYVTVIGNIYEKPELLERESK